MRSTALLALMLLAAGDTLQSRACDTNTQNPTPDVTPTPPGSQAPVFTTQDGVRFRVEVVVNNLEIPWSLGFAPDGRLFVTERHGRVQIIDTARQTSQLALTLDDVFTDGEAGLLGFALDPSFGSNGLVYLYYTARGPGGRPVNRVVRYRESGNRLAERVVLLDDIPANVIHDGGRLRFGPDGLLYITAGDAATEQLAQDVASLAGKILRINPDGTTPRGNPFSSPVYVRPSQPAGDRLASDNRRTLGVGTRRNGQRRNQCRRYGRQLWMAAHRRQPDDAGDARTDNVLQPRGRAERSVLLSRTAVPAICEQPFRRHAARHAPAAASARSHCAASDRRPGTSARGSIRTHS